MPLSHENLSYIKTNVTDWSSLTALFKHAISRQPINHVFANAGIGGRTAYIDEKLDENGDLLEPTHEVYDINLRGLLNTCALAMHYMRKQLPASSSNEQDQENGLGATNSIVVTASCSSFQAFSSVDYATSKHAVLGYMRGMSVTLESAGIPIRINAIAPSWTITGLAPDWILKVSGVAWQLPDAVAQSVALLMADKARNGELIYSVKGKFREVEKAVYVKALADVLKDDEEEHEVAMRRVVEVASRIAKEQQEQASKGAGGTSNAAVPQGLLGS